METKWLFLQPWLEALRSNLVHHHNDDDEEEEAQPIHAELDCWPEFLDEYNFDDPDFTVERWKLFVDFPTDDASRRDKTRLQQVREAMELFNMLAVVDNKSFKKLLSDFIGTVDSTCLIHPVWECSLRGTLTWENPIAKQAKVTWGALFGCPEDPWEYSLKFRDAMAKLEAMDEEHDNDGDGDCPEGIESTLTWYMQNEAASVNGVQETRVYSAMGSHCEELSRKLGELFGLVVPPLVHVCAVQERASVVKAWRQVGNAGVVSLDSVEMSPNFVGAGVTELTVALARTATATLQLSLSNQDIPRHQRLSSITNAGFMFSTLFCGGSLCRPLEADSDIDTTQQLGKIGDLELHLSLDPNTRFDGIYSALAESTTITSLTIQLEEDGDVRASRSHWAWLAYACWGHPTAKRLDRSVFVSPLSLTAQDVSTVKQVLTNCFPKAVEESGDTPQYGVASVRAGSELRPCGLGSEDGTKLMLERDYRFRALYDPLSMQNHAQVVVPGYGLCEVELMDGVTVFARDTAEVSVDQAQLGGSLHLDFDRVESGRVVTDLLALIAGNLRSLSIEVSGAAGVKLDLCAVAAVCPKLEELQISGFNVQLSLERESLRDWGIRILSITESLEVTGLADCLSDSTYRMSRQLQELEVDPVDGPVSRKYVDALIAHNGDPLSIVERPLPLDAKAAMISIVSGDQSTRKAKATRESRQNRQRSVHRLDEDTLRLIFEMAAKPMRRIVEVDQYPRA